jgi:FkbH-like protein
MDQQVAATVEAVRLVIWDLDETFWRGTITEGGIREYLQLHHDIVVTLARRGIISSICSKNDEAPTLAILRDYGIADYFVFPSISWEPKGPRIAALIEAVQLRPATVMFIDDNPNNRAEAAAFVPDLQIEDETFIPRMLDDRRFKGKDDAALSRLAQYRLLETRKRDEAKSGADNSAFLRESNVQVFIEHDVLQHLDRAIELINRTNQLNFTKQRLPEKIEKARAMLTKQLASFRNQAGLVRVVDRYGDYGFVGFFLIRSNTRPLSAGDALHYCFSCRTLGLQVERWLYEQLGRPDLTVVGEVQADLFAAGEIDWIRFGGTGGDESAEIQEDVIRINGGCEATVVAHYLRAHARTMEVTSNFASGRRVGGAAWRVAAAVRHRPGRPGIPGRVRGAQAALRADGE